MKFPRATCRRATPAFLQYLFSRQVLILMCCWAAALCTMGVQFTPPDIEAPAERERSTEPELL